MGSLWERRRDLDASQVRILKSLYDNKKRGTLDCKTPITYALSKSRAGQMGFGRYYGTIGSLETLQRDIRSTLCAEYYTDIELSTATRPSSSRWRSSGLRCPCPPSSRT